VERSHSQNAVVNVILDLTAAEPVGQLVTRRINLHHTSSKRQPGWLHLLSCCAPPEQNSQPPPETDRRSSEAHQTAPEQSEAIRWYGRLGEKIRAVELGVNLTKNDVSGVDGLMQEVDAEVKMFGTLAATD
jgi:hypothetical protein